MSEQQTIQILVQLIIMYFMFYGFLKIIGIDLNKGFGRIFKIIFFPIILIFKGLIFLIPPLAKLLSWIILNPSKKEVRKVNFMGIIEKSSILKSSNKGILVDGDSKKINEKQSLRHFAIVGNSGSGKTSKYIIPNVLSIQNSSMVITDLSGDIYNQTSKYLQEQGFKIKVFAPESLDISHTYNPLLRIRNLSEQEKSKEIGELSQILITSNLSDNNQNDNFFNQSAMRILNILIYALVSQEHEKYCNFHNLNLLLNRFSSNKDSIDNFIIENTVNNKSILEEYRTLTANTKTNTLQSVLLSAQLSVSNFTNQNLAKLTTTNTIDLNQLREEKTALFIIIPEPKLDYYSFLLNILYTQMFSFCMSKSEAETKNKLAIYFLLDEFGHLKIPNFPTIIATIRKYKVSLSLVLQSIKQLEIYGRAEAITILQGSISNQIYLTMDFDTAKQISQILGKTTTTETTEAGFTSQTSQELMTTNELMNLEDKSKAIFLMSSKKPILLKIKPYYEQNKFNIKVDLGSINEPTRTNDINLEYLSLN